MDIVNHTRPVPVKLSKNLVKKVKRGHAWVYADALQQLPQVQPGTPAVLLDKKGRREIAHGFLDPASPIAFRACTTRPGALPDSSWALHTMHLARTLRYQLFYPFQKTNAYRLFNGEGDGLPGLVCDIYDHAAVIATDGLGPENFWQVEPIAHWLAEEIGVKSVYHKSKSASETVQVWGSHTDPTVYFQENDLTFSANLVAGHKTGFYLDQRDNRAALLPFSAGKKVLNVFGYTGGFSIYTGKGNAAHVTTVDIARPALEIAQNHWEYNQLSPGRHRTVEMDAFEFLSKAAKNQERWDLTILDPPSFAPSQASLPNAEKAYLKLISLGAEVTGEEGLLAAASCSSHVRRSHFHQIIEESISKARRQARIIFSRGQPPDHPAPLVMPELHYLKFVLLSLD